MKNQINRKQICTKLRLGVFVYNVAPLIMIVNGYEHRNGSEVVIGGGEANTNTIVSLSMT